MSDELRAGVRISEHLELVSLLGSGAMGSVWLGRDHKLDRDVAIKVILDDPSDARSQQRFEREAKVAAGLDHPHVIQVFDFGWYGDFPFIVMERLDGEPLDERLHRDGRLSLRDAERLVAQIGQALKVMHDDGVVHRDIKPANLFLLAKVDDLFVKIIDFGIARAPVADGTGMTTTGALVGTPSYMSPEQLFDGVRATAASDLWALAVVAFEACTGQLPFAADNIAGLGKLLSAGRFEAPSKLHGDLPPALDDFFARALSIDPEARFEDASAFLAAWSEAMAANGQPQRENQPSEPTPSVTAVTERRELGTMGRYRLLLELGQGGMAEVFVALAVDEAMGADKLVVLKRPHAHDDAMARQMFLDEARIAARLRHRNVVQTLEAGEADGVPFIVMEYLEGQSLRRWMKEGLLPEALRVHVVIEMLRGLHSAHETKDFDGAPLGVIHRDVSPHNVMVTYEGEIKLLDFGIAKATHRLTDTRSGTVKGKATYMAPEQARGDAVDRRVDVFAVGVVLWELLSGRRFWGDAKPKEIEHRLRAGELPDEMPDTADVLLNVCRRALEAEPKARFDTAKAMADALEGAVTDVETSPRKALAALAAKHFADERCRMEAELERTLTAAFAETAEAPPTETHTKTELASPKTVVTRTQTMSSAPPPSRAADPPRRIPIAAGFAVLAAAGLGWFATRDTTPSETTPTAEPTTTQTATAAPQPEPPPTTSTSTTSEQPPSDPTPQDPPPTSAPATMPAPPAPPTAAPPPTTRPFDDHDPWPEAAPSATN